MSGASRLQPTFGWDEYSATGGALTMMANRISYFFNLTGTQEEREERESTLAILVLISTILPSRTKCDL